MYASPPPVTMATGWWSALRVCARACVRVVPRLASPGWVSGTVLLSITDHRSWTPSSNMIAPQDKETSAPERRSGRMAAAGGAAGLLVLGLVGTLMVSPAPAGKVATVTRIPTMTLSNGVEYPLIASNTADLTAEQTDIALRIAALAGIKNVDFHDNDEINGVAKAIKAMGRDAFFLATKINKPPPDMSDPAAAKALAQKQFDDNMAVLGVDFLDTLMLKDSPYCEVMQAQWEVVEDLCASPPAPTRYHAAVRACVWQAPQPSIPHRARVPSSAPLPSLRSARVALVLARGTPEPRSLLPSRAPLCVRRCAAATPRAARARSASTTSARSRSPASSRRPRSSR